MSKDVQLSLIVTYRGRDRHLRTQIAWWKMQLRLGNLPDCEMVVVEADEIPSDWIQSEIYGTNIQYVHLPCVGLFHKTKALNLGLALAKGEFVAPFDVDLIPVGDTLGQHLQMASKSPCCLITGYRVMSKFEAVDVENIEAAREETFIAPEDMPTAVWKHLVRRERFGVVPFFKRERLIEIGGWDEAFVGWGGEDQDIMERYLQDGCFLCRSPELVYLHLFHEPNNQWAESEFVEENRDRYYAKMNIRQKDS